MPAGAQLPLLQEKLVDIVVELSRGGLPHAQDTPYRLARKYYAESPTRMRELTALLMERLGDQMQGRCGSDFCHLTWQPGADFHTLPVADITSPHSCNISSLMKPARSNRGAMPSHERWST